MLENDTTELSVGCSDSATKKGHLLILTDAGQNKWERRWFVLKRWVVL